MCPTPAVSGVLLTRQCVYGCSARRASSILRELRLEARTASYRLVAVASAGPGAGASAREGAGQRASTPNMDGTRKMSGGGVFSAASYLVPCEQGRRALGMVTLWHGQSAVVLPEMRDKSADTYRACVCGQHSA